MRRPCPQRKTAARNRTCASRRASVCVYPSIDQAISRVARRYRVRHGRQTACASMNRGVRQGCALAPLLFSAVAAYYLRRLSLRTNLEWVQKRATLFADDSHLSWEIGSAEDLNKMQKMIQVTFSLFAELRMKVNPEKPLFFLQSEAGPAANG